MKSVTATEVAALIAWRVVSAGDRVGAIIFNDSEIREIKPQRSKKTVLQILQHIRYILYPRQGSPGIKTIMFAKM